MHRFAAVGADHSQRRAACPKPEYQEELPVSARRADIAQAIAEHQVVIVCGETGSANFGVRDELARSQFFSDPDCS